MREAAGRIELRRVLVLVLVLDDADHLLGGRRRAFQLLEFAVDERELGFERLDALIDRVDRGLLALVALLGDLELGGDLRLLALPRAIVLALADLEAAFDALFLGERLGLLSVEPLLGLQHHSALALLLGEGRRAAALQRG